MNIALLEMKYVTKYPCLLSFLSSFQDDMRSIVNFDGSTTDGLMVPRITSTLHILMRTAQIYTGKPYGKCFWNVLPFNNDATAHTRSKVNYSHSETVFNPATKRFLPRPIWWMCYCHCSFSEWKGCSNLRKILTDDRNARVPVAAKRKEAFILNARIA